MENTTRPYRVPVAGFWKYKVDRQGHVWRDGQPVKVYASPSGDVLGVYTSSGRHTTMMLRNFVALAYLGTRPDGHRVYHKDGNRDNCSPDNLEYRPCKNSQFSTPGMRVVWDKRRDKAVLTSPTKADQDLLESILSPTVLQELDRRGYDLSTLEFSVRRYDEPEAEEPLETGRPCVQTPEPTATTGV